MADATFLHALEHHLEKQYQLQAPSFDLVYPYPTYTTVYARALQGDFVVWWMPIGVNSQELEATLPAWHHIATKHTGRLPRLRTTKQGTLASTLNYGICVVQYRRETDWYLPSVKRDAVHQVAALHTTPVPAKIAIPQETFEMRYSDTFLPMVRGMLTGYHKNATRQQIQQLLDENIETIQFLWRRFQMLTAQCTWSSACAAVTHGNPVADWVRVGKMPVLATGAALKSAPPERDLWQWFISEKRHDVIAWYRESVPDYHVDELACQYYALRYYFEQLDYAVDMAWHAPDAIQGAHYVDVLGQMSTSLLPVVAHF